MNGQDLFLTLMNTEKVADVNEALESYCDNSAGAKWVPFGNRDNNRGTIEVSANPGRALIERVTNGIDAVLEAEHDRHDGRPDCRSPREAVSTWLGVPPEGLAAMSQSQRQSLANRVVLRLLNGEGRNSRCVEVIDKGVGLSAHEMPGTILSLNESHKVQKFYLAGTYGQGGSATFASCTFTLIASRKSEANPVAFTVVKYLDLPPDEFKTGHYVYLVHDRRLLEADYPVGDFSIGTICKHFGYDLTMFPSPLGPRSIYGLLQQVLFQPVLPLWFDNHVHDYRRVIKGSGSALRGAVDVGDLESRGPKLSFHMKMFFTHLAEFGQIGIEYWVLEHKDKTPAIATFVDPRHPIILTLNGQNQAEYSSHMVKKDAELPYLTRRLVCHIDCNTLTPSALRHLFVSNREGARGGIVDDMIRQELIQALKSDDELKRLNDEARDLAQRERDEVAEEQTRKEVAKLLELQGFDVSEDDVSGGSGSGEADTTPRPPRPPRKPKVIDLQEPPTYIKILGPEDKPIKFWPDQRKYIRIETDANSNYHDAIDSGASKINIIIEGASWKFTGSTPLTGGRLRAEV